VTAEPDLRPGMDARSMGIQLIALRVLLYVFRRSAVAAAMLYAR